MSNKRFRSTFSHEGKRYECTGKNQREADQKAALKLDKLKRGEAGISGNMTVARWANEWLEVYKRPAVGEGQYRRYRGIIDKIIVPDIGAQPIKTIKDVQLQKIINGRAGKSKSDIKKLRDTIKAIFTRAHASKLIGNNPAEYLEMPAAPEGKRRSITGYERNKILELAETHPAGLWVKLTLYCGIRPGEARALDWRHIDTNKKILHIEQAMKSRTKVIGKPKSDAGIRDIPIPDALISDLLAAKADPFEPVIVKPLSEKRHDEHSMMFMWNNFKRELDISMGAQLYRNKIIISVVASELTAYCLRHTYCTDLQDAGVPINVARYLMGHSDIRVTSKIYTHTTDKAIEDARERINALSSGADENSGAAMPTKEAT
jgi:integrase